MLRPDPERLSTPPPYRRSAPQALTEPLTTRRNPHRPRQRRRSLTVPRFPPLEAFERRPDRHVRSVAHRPASETLHRSGHWPRTLESRNGTLAWVICCDSWHSAAPAERLRFRGLCVQAPEPPSRWIGSPPDRRRRCRRLPFHTNGVGCSFQRCAVCSNQHPISSGLCGCCPSSARRLSTRSIDSALLSQLPPTGVSSGMTPCAHSHSTSSGVLWPVRLSHTSNSRSGGRSSGRVKGSVRPACHTAQAACVAAASCDGAGGGSAARIALRRSRSHGCRTAFVQQAADCSRTWPVAGWNRVRILVVPPRMYSCGWVAGCSRGCHDTPACGTAWNGPASSSHQTDSPSWAPSV